MQLFEQDKHLPSLKTDTSSGHVSKHLFAKNKYWGVVESQLVQKFPLSLQVLQGSSHGKHNPDLSL